MRRLLPLLAVSVLAGCGGLNDDQRVLLQPGIYTGDFALGPAGGQPTNRGVLSFSLSPEGVVRGTLLDNSVPASPFRALFTANRAANGTLSNVEYFTGTEPVQGSGQLLEGAPAQLQLSIPGGSSLTGSGLPLEIGNIGNLGTLAAGTYNGRFYHFNRAQGRIYGAGTAQATVNSDSTFTVNLVGSGDITSGTFTGTFSPSGTINGGSLDLGEAIFTQTAATSRNVDGGSRLHLPNAPIEGSEILVVLRR